MKKTYKMPTKRRNSLIITLAIFIVLVVSASAYFIIKAKAPIKKEGGLLLGFVGDSGVKEYLSVDEFKNLRKYKVYKLKADTADNNKLLEKARQELRLIKQTHDTIHGVNIVIGDDTTYDYYIRAVEICSEEEPRAFVPYKNDIYAWYIYLPLKKKEENKMDK